MWTSLLAEFPGTNRKLEAEFLNPGGQKKFFICILGFFVRSSFVRNRKEHSKLQLNGCYEDDKLVNYELTSSAIEQIFDFQKMLVQNTNKSIR